MKNLRRVFPLLALLLLLSAPSTAGKVFFDSIALDYDTSNIKLEEVPRSDYEKMDLEEGPWWFIAKYSGEGADGREFIMVNGLTRAYNDVTNERHGEPYSDFGVVLSYYEGRYTTRGIPDYLERDSMNLGPKVVEGLLDDYVRRAVEAFGGPDKVQAEIERHNRHPWMDSCVARAFARAGIRVPPEMVHPERKKAK